MVAMEIKKVCGSLVPMVEGSVYSCAFQEIIHRPVSRSKSRGKDNHCKTGRCSYFQTFAILL